MANVDDILNDFASNVTRLAKINLGKYKNVNGKRRRIDNSGNLRRSLDYKVVKNDFGYSVVFTMLDYGQYVDRGRKKGKGMPVKELKAWIKSKPVRLRDLKTGRLLPTTESGINSLSFLINRKIKEKGMAPTNFISDPLRQEFEKLDSELRNGILKEMDLILENQINKIQSK